MRRSNKMPPDFAKRVSAGLKTMHARKRREAAQARLNRAAVAWLSRGQGKQQNIMHRILELERAVRAFQKFNATPTKGKK